VEAVNCPGFTTAALSLNSVTLNESTSSSGGTINFDFHITFSPLGPSGVTWSGFGGNNAISDGGSGSQTATAGVTIADFNLSSGFDVFMLGVTEIGSGTSTTGALSVTYNFAPASSAVPEPSTLPLLFSASVILLIARTIAKSQRRDRADRGTTVC
jgi:hypothetical protein